ncbi:MAG TPA: PQQ-binding-like beta-propeller repeat protein [Candidatus Acidoferrum sp.]|jgi:outer membrane protein assembly factor BamB
MRATALMPNRFLPHLWRGNTAALFSILLVSSVFLLASCGKKNTSATAEQKTGPRIKWQYKSAAIAVSHPAIGPDGTIYAGAHGGLLALSADGKLLWQARIGEAGTPVISDDGTIYLDTWHGSLYGVGKDGQLVWQPGYGLIGFNAPPALGAGTTLYYLNNVSDIYAFRPKQSNEKLWSLDTFREGMLGAETVLPGSARVGVISTKAAPILTRNESLILPRQSFLHSLSTSGAPEWDLELSSGNLGQAAVAEDGTIYVGDDRSVLYAVDSSGSEKWRFDASGSVQGSPVIDTAGVVYFTAGDAVYALNPDGSLKWRFSPLQRLGISTSPVLAADGTLYVGGEFALIALNPDGVLKWNLRIYSPTSSPTIGPDGTIYFACGYSWICAVEDKGSPLMQSAWPKQFHDLANTSNSLHRAL